MASAEADLLSKLAIAEPAPAAPDAGDGGDDDDDDDDDAVAGAGDAGAGAAGAAKKKKKKNRKKKKSGAATGEGGAGTGAVATASAAEKRPGMVMQCAARRSRGAALARVGGVGVDFAGGTSHRAVCLVDLHLASVVTSCMWQRLRAVRRLTVASPASRIRM